MLNNQANPLLDSPAFKLHRATILIDRLADAYLYENHGIRYAPFLVLLMARMLGPTSQQAIAANLAVSRSSVTQRVAGLVASELLVVEPDPTDRRANLVVISAAGAELFDRAWSGLNDREDGIEDGIDILAFMTQLDRIIANALAALGRSDEATSDEFVSDEPAASQDAAASQNDAS